MGGVVVLMPALPSQHIQVVRHTDASAEINELRQRCLQVIYQSAIWDSKLSSQKMNIFRHYSELLKHAKAFKISLI